MNKKNEMIPKALLVIDMPSSCVECPFAYEYEQMYFCKTLRKITGTKDECPLKPMPERINPLKVDCSNLLDLGYMHGRNDLINEMEGEEE